MAKLIDITVVMGPGGSRRQHPTHRMDDTQTSIKFKQGGGGMSEEESEESEEER